MADPLSWPGDVAGFLTNPFGITEKADDLLARDEHEKLSAVLARNGWGPANGDLNRRARAIVRRESSGNPTVQNPSGATGLFQIMTPLHCGSYGIPKPTAECVTWLKDPDHNANAARVLHRSAGWQPWVSSGPIPPPPTSWDIELTTKKDYASSTPADAVTTVASPFITVGKAAVDLISALLSADTWFRIGKTWLGLVFIITGTGALVYIIANQASGGATGRAAKMAVTKGVVK